MAGYSVEYSCDSCEVSVAGESWDPQEAPELYCPDCGDKMDLEVDWK